ncbi:MAG TPA: hypothetical protein DD001_18180, partial [Microcoleaceae bacterium UBA10368]|nr:hypothetical protein [Microcoleaceae cyanobacterium UBA10368]
EDDLTANSETKTPLDIATNEDNITAIFETETPTKNLAPEDNITATFTTKTPTKYTTYEDDSTANYETETPSKIAATEEISNTINEPETLPIVADIAPETIDNENYPTQLNQTAIPSPKTTPIWQVFAVFLSGMLVGSVLSLGTLVAWRMYQERVNLQIKLPSDVPLPPSPSPVLAAPANRLPAIPPAPGTAQLPNSLPSPTPTVIPSLSGAPQLP